MYVIFRDRYFCMSKLETKCHLVKISVMFIDFQIIGKQNELVLQNFQIYLFNIQSNLSLHRSKI